MRQFRLGLEKALICHIYIIANYKDELLKLIDADQLPVHWGGELTDPDGDPKCRSKVRIKLICQLLFWLNIWLLHDKWPVGPSWCDTQTSLRKWKGCLFWHKLFKLFFGKLCQYIIKLYGMVLPSPPFHNFIWQPRWPPIW